MESLLGILPLLGVWALALATPGPDFLTTARYATARSRRDGVLVGLGVTSAISIWAAAGLLGLSTLLARASWLYDSVRLAGAAYLAYMGIRALMSLRRRSDEPAPGEGGASADGDQSRMAIWRVGFLTNIGNPKAAVFFGSLFTALLPAHPATWLDGVVLAAMLSMAAVWFTAVACLFSLAPVARAYHRAKRAIDAVTGCVFIALAGRLVAE